MVGIIKGAEKDHVFFQNHLARRFQEGACISHNQKELMIILASDLLFLRAGQEGHTTFCWYQEEVSDKDMSLAS